MMNNADFFKMCKEGERPVVKMGKDIKEFGMESFDPGIVGKVTRVNIECDDRYCLVIDMSDYEEHNRSVALSNRRDSNGGHTACWLDTQYYPEDGREGLYIPIWGNIPFEIIHEETLFAMYLEDKCNTGYVKWLEMKVKELA